MRDERLSFDERGATMDGHGVCEAVVRGMVDMMRATDDGLDAGVPRTADTPASASPTTFRTWCEQVLTPAVVDG